MLSPLTTWSLCEGLSDVLIGYEHWHQPLSVSFFQIHLLYLQAGPKPTGLGVGSIFLI